MTRSGRIGPARLRLLLGAILLASGTAGAQLPQDNPPVGDVTAATLREAALTHARSVTSAAATLTAGVLDERLRLPACTGPIAARTASESPSALSVELRCDAAGWKLFVPVNVREQVAVLVLRRPLARGDSVSAADVDVQRRDRATLGLAWLGEIAQLQGRVATRAIPAGTVLSPMLLEAERVVRRGASVVLLGISGGFLVRAEGKALADAAAGESVRVQNLSSRRVVQGQVQADGTVRVEL
jgi:flagella basal body P-ring formation protein FlgA